MTPTTDELLAVAVGLIQTSLFKWHQGASASDIMTLVEAAEKSIAEVKERLRIHMGD